MKTFLFCVISFLLGTQLKRKPEEKGYTKWQLVRDIKIDLLPTCETTSVTTPREALASLHRARLKTMEILAKLEGTEND